MPINPYTPSGSTTGSKSGSFTNLNQYLEANKDQAQGLGGKLQENVQKSANTGLQDLSKSQQEFKTAQNDGAINPNDYSMSSVSNTVKNAVSNPSGVAQSDIDAFNKVRAQNAAFQAGTDTAPKDLTKLNSYQTAAGELTQAQQQAGLTGTEAGRQTLLQQAFKRPTYTQGQVGLDQLLTQNTPENRQRFEDLRNNLLGQYGLASQQTQAIQNSAADRQNAITGTQQAATNISNVLTGTAPSDVTDAAAKNQYGVLNQYAQQLQDKPAQLMAEQAQAKQQALDYLTNYYKTHPTYGIDPATLAAQIVGTASPGAATIQNSLTPDELARLNVLNKLAGNEPGMLGKTLLGTPDTNLFNPSISVDYSKAPQQIKDAQNVYANKIKTQTDQILTTIPVKAFGQNLTGAQGIQYVLDAANLNMKNPAANGDAAAAVSKTLQDQIDILNATRTQYGLAPLKPTPVSSQDVINEMVKGSTQKNALQWLTNNYNTSRPWSYAINQRAQLQGLYNLLQQIQKDPFSQVAGVGNTPQNIPGSNVANFNTQPIGDTSGQTTSYAPTTNTVAQPDPVFLNAPTKQ